MASEEERKARLLRAKQERLNKILATSAARSKFLNDSSTTPLETFIQQENEEQQIRNRNQARRNIPRPHLDPLRWILVLLLFLYVSYRIFTSCIRHSLLPTTCLKCQYWLTCFAIIVVVHVFKLKSYRDALVCILCFLISCSLLPLDSNRPYTGRGWLVWVEQSESHYRQEYYSLS